MVLRRKGNSKSLLRSPGFRQALVTLGIGKRFPTTVPAVRRRLDWRLLDQRPLVESESCDVR